MRETMKNKGFTLNELLVIVAIIGIITAIALPVMLGIIQEMNESADAAQASLVSETLNDWTVDYENFKLKARDGVVGYIGDATSDRIIRIMKIGCVELQDKSDFEKSDFEQFENACLNAKLYPKDAVMLRLIVGQYMNGEASIFKTRTNENAFYYIPNSGTVIASTVTATAEQIKEQSLDYEITSADIIYKLDDMGDKTLSLLN